MSYSLPMLRRAATFAIGLAVALAAGLAATQLLLPGVIRERVEAAIARHDGLRGEVRDVRVCAPCASYTLVQPSFEVRARGASRAPANEAWRPSFSADAVVVSLMPASLRTGSLAGRLDLESPHFHFAAQGSSRVSWRAIGDALLPLPIDGLAVLEGRVELTNEALEPPVRWRIDDVQLVGRNLARLAPAPIELDAEGRMGDEGRITGRLRLPEGGGFRLAASLHAVPVGTFNDYLRNGLGLDVHAGSLDADGAVTGSDRGELRGHIDCRVADLDLIEIGDLTRQGPISLAWETLAASITTAAGAASRGVLEFQVEIRESVEDPSVDAWSLFGTILRRSLWGLLRSPATALRWLAERVSPLDAG